MKQILLLHTQFAYISKKTYRSHGYIYFGVEDLTNDVYYNDLQKRANYLNTIMYECCSKTEYVNRQKEIKDMLGKYSIRIEWAKLHWNLAGEPNYYDYEVKDTCSRLMLDKIVKDEILFLQYLFGENSTIIAGYDGQYEELIRQQKEKYPQGEEYDYYNEQY